MRQWNAQCALEKVTRPMCVQMQLRAHKAIFKCITWLLMCHKVVLQQQEKGKAKKN